MVKKTRYLRSKLAKVLAQGVARVCFGADNLGVSQSAWENIEWKDSFCEARRKTESDSHTLPETREDY